MIFYRICKMLSVSVCLSFGSYAAAKTNVISDTYRNAPPQSILVLPPVNDSPDIRAMAGFYTTTTVPIVSAGYYVFPIALVDQTFKENGVSNPAEINNIPTAKLHEIFGADSALYIRVKEYGSKFQVLASVTTVSAEAKLVDLKTGEILWSGEEKLSLSDSNNSSGGGLLGMVVSAAINQIGNNARDSGHTVSHSVSYKLFSPSKNGNTGLLRGPRSTMAQN